MSVERDHYQVDLTLADAMQMNAIGRQVQRLSRRVAQLDPRRSSVSVRVSFTEPVARSSVSGPNGEMVRHLMNAVYQVTGSSVQASLVLPRGTNR